jgi:hypothetical protein
MDSQAWNRTRPVEECSVTVLIEGRYFGGSVLKRFFDLLNEMILSIRGSYIEAMNDEGWVTDVAFLVIVTGHLSSRNRYLQITVVTKCVACFSVQKLCTFLSACILRCFIWVARLIQSILS